jgi:hypothetical protein
VKSSHILAALGLAAPAVVAACAVYTEDLLVDGEGGAGPTTSSMSAGASQPTSSSSGPGGAGGASSSSSSSSGGGECLAPEDCPGNDTACKQRSCVAKVCGVVNAAAGTMCSEQGGKVCDGSGDCLECLNETHCSNDEECGPQNTCQPPGKKADGQSCALGTECQSGHCIDGVCCNTACTAFCFRCNSPAAAGTCSAVADGEDPDSECGMDSCNGEGLCRCSDGKANGAETDADCGGGVCAACADGKLCSIASDCLSGICNGTCQAPSCNDSMKNGNETDVDCGGTCPTACADGKMCAVAADCQSGVCNGVCQAPLCGDSVTNGSEDCDDGATDSFDGCSANCLNPVGHLLISEFVVTPTAGEFVEIYNPTNAAISLSNVYLADFKEYYQIANATVAPVLTDFLLRFPANATLAAQSFAVVALESATAFQNTFQVLPDFDLDPSDQGAPSMLGTFGSGSGLTNSGEVLVLFYWDGVSELVTDLDYVPYGATTSLVNKTGITIGSSSYLADTPNGNQKLASSPPNGRSGHRCDTAEQSETKSGGNGAMGHDATSEDHSTAFKNLLPPTPGKAPPAGFCP